MPSAVGNELARSPRTSISDEAVWSDPFALPGQSRRAKTVSLMEAAAFSGIGNRIRLMAGAWPSQEAFARDPVLIDLADSALRRDDGILSTA